MPGHFPGQPIVPGVLLLSRVVAAIEEHWPDADVIGAQKIRFHTPLKPGESFRINVVSKSGPAVSFEIQREGVRIASGTFLLRSVANVMRV